MTAPSAPNLTVLLIIVGRRVQDRLEEELLPLGIAQRHVSALGHLAADSGVSYSELARRSSVTAQSVQATLQRLEEIGAVTQTSVAQQGKRASLTLTPAGRRLLRKAKACIDRVENELVASIGNEQQPVVIAALLELTGAVSGSAGTQRRGRGPRRA